MRDRKQICRRKALACVLTLLSASVCADNTYWRPHLQLGGGFDNNVRMAYEDVPGQDIEASTVYQTQADVELGADNGAERNTLFARYWYQSVADNHDYDADITQLRWNFAQTQAHGTLSFNLDAQADTTLTSEIESSGLPLQEKKDRHRIDSSLAYRWTLSERGYVNTEISAENVRYLNAKNTGLRDYDTRSASASYGYAINERANLGIQLMQSEFDILPVESGIPGFDVSNETDNTILTVFGDYNISEREKVSLQGGFRSSSFYNESYNEFGPITQKEKENGRVFSATYSRQFATASLQIAATRDLRPNGAGAVVEQDSVSTTLTESLTARLFFNANISANRQHEAVSGTTTSVSGIDREFAQLQLGLRYAASEEHFFSIELLDRWQQYESNEKYDGRGASAFLRWNWNPPQQPLP